MFDYYRDEIDSVVRNILQDLFKKIARDFGMVCTMQEIDGIELLNFKCQLDSPETEEYNAVMKLTFRVELNDVEIHNGERFDWASNITLWIEPAIDQIVDSDYEMPYISIRDMEYPYGYDYNGYEPCSSHID